MAVNKLKIMLSFMRELNDGVIPTANDYEISNNEFWDIIEACEDAGYIKNVRYRRGAQERILVCIVDYVNLQ